MKGLPGTGDEVTISWEYYCRLVESSDKLSFLMEYGVDNWDGYDEALAAMRDYYVAEEESAERWLAENGD